MRTSARARAARVTPLFARRSHPEPPPRRSVPAGRIVVGRCDACAVTFVGPLDEVGSTHALLLAHVRVCPGGARNGEVVEPIAAFQDEPYCRPAAAPSAR